MGILLSRSTSILEIPDSNGLTSLHVAAKNGHFEMVQNLLGQGSDLNSKDKVASYLMITTRKEIFYHIIYLLDVLTKNEKEYQ